MTVRETPLHHHGVYSFIWGELIPFLLRGNLQSGSLPWKSFLCKDHGISFCSWNDKRTTNWNWIYLMEELYRASFTDFSIWSQQNHVFVDVRSRPSLWTYPIRWRTWALYGIIHQTDDQNSQQEGCFCHIGTEKSSFPHREALNAPSPHPPQRMTSIFEKKWGQHMRRLCLSIPWTWSLFMATLLSKESPQLLSKANQTGTHPLGLCFIQFSCGLAQLNLTLRILAFHPHCFLPVTPSYLVS